MSYERQKPDGTPILASVVLWAGEAAEFEGAIDLADLEIIRSLADILHDRNIDDLETLEKRLTPV